jgi:hypothetical protein
MYSNSNPRYIGFRVNRYGPSITSAVVGRIGTILVPDAQKRRKLQVVSVRHDNTSAAPKTRPVPTGNRGTGTYRWKPMPTRKNAT